MNEQYATTAEILATIHDCQEVSGELIVGAELCHDDDRDLRDLLLHHALTLETIAGDALDMRVTIERFRRQERERFGFMPADIVAIREPKFIPSSTTSFAKFFGRVPGLHPKLSLSAHLEYFGCTDTMWHTLCSIALHTPAGEYRSRVHHGGSFKLSTTELLGFGLHYLVSSAGRNDLVVQFEIASDMYYSTRVEAQCLLSDVLRRWPKTGVSLPNHLVQEMFAYIFRHHNRRVLVFDDYDKYPILLGDGFPVRTHGSRNYYVQYNFICGKDASMGHHVKMILSGGPDGLIYWHAIGVPGGWSEFTWAKEQVPFLRDRDFTIPGACVINDNLYRNIDLQDVFLASHGPLEVNADWNNGDTFVTKLDKRFTEALRPIAEFFMGDPQHRFHRLDGKTPRQDVDRCMLLENIARLGNARVRSNLPHQVRSVLFLPFLNSYFGPERARELNQMPTEHIAVEWAKKAGVIIPPDIAALYPPDFLESPQLQQDKLVSSPASPQAQTLSAASVAASAALSPVVDAAAARAAETLANLFAGQRPPPQSFPKSKTHIVALAAAAAGVATLAAAAMTADSKAAGAGVDGLGGTVTLDANDRDTLGYKMTDAGRAQRDADAAMNAKQRASDAHLFDQNKIAFKKSVDHGFRNATTGAAIKRLLLRAFGITGARADELCDFVRTRLANAAASNITTEVPTLGQLLREVRQDGDWMRILGDNAVGTVGQLVSDAVVDAVCNVAALSSPAIAAMLGGRAPLVYIPLFHAPALVGDGALARSHSRQLRMSLHSAWLVGTADGRRVEVLAMHCDNVHFVAAVASVVPLGDAVAAAAGTARIRASIAPILIAAAAGGEAAAETSVAVAIAAQGEQLAAVRQAAEAAAAAKNPLPRNATTAQQARFTSAAKKAGDDAVSAESGRLVTRRDAAAAAAADAADDALLPIADIVVAGGVVMGATVTLADSLRPSAAGKKLHDGLARFVDSERAAHAIRRFSVRKVVAPSSRQPGNKECGAYGSCNAMHYAVNGRFGTDADFDAGGDPWLTAVALRLAVLDVVLTGRMRWPGSVQTRLPAGVAVGDFIPQAGPGWWL